MLPDRTDRRCQTARSAGALPTGEERAVSEFVEIPIASDTVLLVERAAGDEVVAAGRLRDVTQAGTGSRTARSNLC